MSASTTITFALTLLLCCCGTLCQDRSLMTLYSATPYDSQAVCNDGSPYKFYYRPGVGSGLNQWVIYFDGGHWCTDATTCNARFSSTPALMSSTSYAATLNHAYGITSPNADTNPYWWGANHVYLNYCTSDIYRGDTVNGKWQFRGKRSVAAAIAVLLHDHNLQAATDIILVGSSAGGPGITANAGDIYNQLIQGGAKPKNYKLYSDGGWFIDLPEYNGGTGPTYQSDAKALQSYAAVTFDSGCTSKYPGATWKCMLPQYNWPYLAAPLISHEYLYDLGNLAEDNAQPSNYEAFRSSMVSSFGIPAGQALGVVNGSAAGKGGPVGQTPPTVNNVAAPLQIFAEACLLHTTVDTPQFTESEVNGYNFNELLWAWFNNQNYQVQVIDSVAGQRSAADCSSPYTSASRARR